MFGKKKKGISKAGVKLPATLVALLFLIVPLIPPVPVYSQTTTAVGLSLPTLEANIDNEMEAGEVPSLQAGIIINDTLVWAKGFGDQPSLDTVFSIASISKTFTATAFLQLHEQGLVDLDADVSDYLPFEVRNPHYPDLIISARMLLSHRAGMTRDYDFGIPWYDGTIFGFINDLYGRSYPVWTEPRPPLGEIINSTNIADLQLWWPGYGEYSYSNSGFFFLSFLLEKITNQSFSAYIDENILTPLGMSSSGLSGSEFSGRLAIPHGTLDNESPVEFPFHEIYQYGAGSVRTTVLDLSKYLIAHMNEGSFNGVKILEPESVDMMHSDVSNNYGLGWNTGSYQGHEGILAGFLADMWYQERPNGSYGIILLINREDVMGRSSSFNARKFMILNLLHQQGRAMTDWANWTDPTTDLTTTTTIDTGPDILLLVGVSGGAAVVIVAVVFILRRRSR